MTVRGVGVEENIISLSFYKGGGAFSKILIKVLHNICKNSGQALHPVYHVKVNFKNIYSQNVKYLLKKKKHFPLKYFGEWFRCQSGKIHLKESEKPVGKIYIWQEFAQ